nr:RNA-directed DNA polymerase, eukaryota [Tanacetum cinerariifolium]
MRMGALELPAVTREPLDPYPNFGPIPYVRQKPNQVSSHNHLHSTVNHNNGRVVSYAKAVNRGAPHVPSPSPAMVLDDSRIVTPNEGFPNVKVAYLGGLWVMLDLESSISKKKLMEHVGVASWFTSLTNAQSDFVSRDRIVWVDIEGVPLHAWSRNTFTKIGTKWGEVMDSEESNDDMFARKRICIKTKQEDNILEKFKIIVRGKNFVIRAKELFAWLPNFKNTNEPVYSSDDESAEGDIADKGGASKIANSDVGSDVEDVSDTIFRDDYKNLDGNQVKEQSRDQEGSYDPFNIYSLLNKQDAGNKGDTTNPSSDKSLGSKAKKDWIRELNNSHKVSFLSIQETKMESISAMDVKLLWGNYNFEYIFSEALDNSGGILFMGDFNEVRFAGERMGSVFNSRGANDFNSFISNSSLVDVQLEGFSFTWSHPSATKMSKLDRFLVSEGFTSLFPHISAIYLDKHLSDHRPILLREVITDYGASSFRFYHSWFKLNGFDQMVSNTWNSFTLDDSNAMIRFKKKLQ